MNKIAVIEQLVAALATVRGIDTAQALKDISARERIGSMLIPLDGCHVAIPHASTSACKQLMMAIAISREGVVWETVSNQRANLIFLLLGPPETQALYLRVLARLARLCQSKDFVEALLDAVSAKDLLEKLAAAELALGELVYAEGSPLFCVLGAGHGGMAMAAHLSIMGYKVNLFNRSEDRIRGVQARGGIDVTGEVEGFAALNIVSTSPAQVLENADIAMIVVPATGHRDIATMIAPHIKDGQIIVLNPGRTGGALEVAHIIRQINPSVRPYIAETQTLLYAARSTNPGQVRIFSIKNSVPLATLPAYQIADIMPVIRKVFPQFIPGDNVLKTSFDNIGAVFHPAITILNAGRIEDTHGNFEYYVEGVTQSVAQVLESIDSERVAVARALGIQVHTAREWLYLAYDAAGKTLLNAMRANAGYRGIQAPATLQHRYISEDVPASLVPIASIGEMFGVPTPTTRAIINLASIMHGVDYWAEGRTVKTLGLEGMSVKDIHFLVTGVEVALPLSAPKMPDAVGKGTSG